MTLILMQLEAAWTIFGTGWGCITKLQGEAARADTAVAENFKDFLEKINEGGYSFFISHYSACNIFLKKQKIYHTLYEEKERAKQSTITSFFTALPKSLQPTPSTTGPPTSKS